MGPSNWNINDFWVIWFGWPAAFFFAHVSYYFSIYLCWDLFCISISCSLIWAGICQYCWFGVVPRLISLLVSPQFIDSVYLVGEWNVWRAAVENLLCRHCSEVSMAGVDGLSCPSTWASDDYDERMTLPGFWVSIPPLSLTVGLDIISWYFDLVLEVRSSDILMASYPLLSVIISFESSVRMNFSIESQFLSCLKFFFILEESNNDV